MAFDGITIHCLVEFDIGMNRCGIDSYEKAYTLAAKIEECSHLEFMGIQAYAGNLAHEFNYNDRRDGSEDIKQRLSALKQYLEELARQIGYEQIELEVVEGNDTAKRLYEKCGFVETGKHVRALKYDDGTYRDEFIMIKVL